MPADSQVRLVRMLAASGAMRFDPSDMPAVIDGRLDRHGIDYGYIAELLALRGVHVLPEQACHTEAFGPSPDTAHLASQERPQPVHQIGPGYCKTCEPGFGHNHPDWQERPSIDRLNTALDALESAMDAHHPEGCGCDLCNAATDVRLALDAIAIEPFYRQERPSIDVTRSTPAEALDRQAESLRMVPANTDYATGYNDALDDILDGVNRPPSTPAEPLDVERLASILFRFDIGCEGHGDRTRHQTSDHREDALAIAAEYARLSRNEEATDD